MSGIVDSTAAPVVQKSYPSRAVAWYTTVLLGVLYWLSVLDRFIISLFVEPIKRDLGITDLQFGMLHGLGFAVTFSVFGLACGAFADRMSRRMIIFAGVSIWSLSTAACGFARQYSQLLLARVGVGAGEAALNPCATSMLADLFPPQRLTLATAIYAMGATIGGGTAFLAGGQIVQMVSHADVYTLPIVGVVRSWQAVFFIVGIPGALLSFAIFTVKEPARRGLRLLRSADRSWGSQYRDLLQFMKPRWRFFVCHYLAFTFAAMVLSGGSWYPVYMARAYGWAPARIGLSLGVVLVASAIFGKWISGRLMDEMFSRGHRDAQLRWYMGCLIAAIPVGLFAFTRSSPWAFLVALGVYMMLLQPMPECAYTSMNLITPNNLRGTGVAFFGATAGLVGAGVGPMLAPAASRFLFHSGSAIGLGMATTAAVCCPSAAVLLALCLRPMREAVADVHGT